MIIFSFHWHIFYLGKEKYSLVLEYAEGGTLRNYLRKNAVPFNWENQLRFAKEIASAILWLHDVKGIRTWGTGK